MLEKKQKELRDRYDASLLSKKDFARELGGISIGTVDRLRKEGVIRSRLVRGQVRFSIEDVAMYLVGGVA